MKLDGIKLDPPSDRGLEQLDWMEVGWFRDINNDLLDELGCTRAALISRVKKSESYRMGTKISTGERMVVKVS